MPIPQQLQKNKYELKANTEHSEPVFALCLITTFFVGATIWWIGNWSPHVLEDLGHWHPAIKILGSTESRHEWLPHSMLWWALQTLTMLPGLTFPSDSDHHFRLDQTHPTVWQHRPWTSARLQWPHRTATCCGMGSRQKELDEFADCKTDTKLFLLGFCSGNRDHSQNRRQQKRSITVMFWKHHLSSDCTRWRAKGVSMLTHVRLVGPWSGTMGHTEGIKIVTTKFRQNIPDCNIELLPVISLQCCHLLGLNFWEWHLMFYENGYYRKNLKKETPKDCVFWCFLPRGALTSHLKYLLIYLNYIHPKMNISIIIFNRMIFFVQTNWNPNRIQRRWLQEWWLSGLIFSIALNVDF